MIEIGEEIGSYRITEIFEYDVIGYCEGNIQPFVLWKSDIIDDVKDPLYFETYEAAIEEIEERHKYDTKIEKVI